MKNYIELRCLLPWKDKYAYMDRKEYFADDLFIKNKIKVRYKGELRNPKYDSYVVVCCEISKKHRKSMPTIFEQLKNNILLSGYSDYLEQCERFSEVLALD